MDIYTNNKNEEFVLTGNKRGSYREIEFLATGFKNYVNMSAIKQGQVKDWMKPSVRGIGIVGEGRGDSRTKVYTIWTRMLGRVTQKHEDRPTYADCTVCNDWCYFTKFRDWFLMKNPPDGWELDKDLLVQGNREYSPKTCCFLPHEINLFLTFKKSTNNSGMSGVCFDNTENKWRVDICSDGVQKRVGCFKSKEEAEKVYVHFKAMEAAKLAERYRSQLQPEAYNVLLNFKERLTR